MKQHLDLFTGAGGGLLAASILGWETVCAVELDAYCRKVLRQRQADGCLDPFHIWPEVRTFDGRGWAGRVDIISAGFPCQPFSLAGKHGGQDDERNLWPETIRVIREVGPRFAFLENVPGLLAHEYFGTILGELAESGFDAEWMVLGADDCGAPHRRKRLWILAANTERDSVRDQPERRQGAARSPIEGHAQPRYDGAEESVADADGRGQQAQREQESAGLEGPPRGDADRCGLQVADADRSRTSFRREDSGVGRVEESAASPDAQRRRLSDSGAAGPSPRPAERSGPGHRSHGWEVEPDVGRVVDGVASRVDRLRAIGNGQVPVVAVRAFLELQGRMG